ncbi:hypothetical protein BLNAU_8151 [Blattamonas nauphoetae]|uniref:Uncharacterized protein n=1 Tax=Blattamonas nauphoetae TaxID=2049346 RepID=A0ABQ9XZL1_9EUKA|nr:hypothetical protein BLNAU_8151 [Blattamonas nauphoetae]
MFQRHCVQSSSSMTTDPVELDKHDLIYSGASSSVINPYNLSLSATICFSLTQFHQVVKVDSRDGRLTLNNCFILSESDTMASVSPICSVGNSLALKNVSFSPTLTSSKANLSAPLVNFTPVPSAGKELGSGSFSMIGSSFTNLTFGETTMFELITAGDVTITTPTLSNIASDQQKGKFLVLKGQSFKTQLKQQWDDNLQVAALVISLLGEDISMDENDKWRTGSLVYWLVSPSSEVVVGSDETAVDHPNCGSSIIHCDSLDSAFTSAGLNNLSTLALSTPMTLTSTFLATSSWLFKSSSATKQGIELDETGSIEVANSTAFLSFATIIFTVAETCVSDTLFVVEEGDLSFSLCQFGATSSESALVLPESTTTLIEVKAGGKLTLAETLIQHITFSHATLGPAIRLHLDSTNSFRGTQNGDNTLHVTGNGQSSTTFQHSGGIDSPLIVQTSGSLAVCDVHFSILEAQTATPRSASFFSISGGSLSLTSVSFLAMSFSGSNSLIKVTGAASLTLSTIDISGMTTEGSGSVLHSTSTGTITLSSVSFSSCNCRASQKGRSVFIERSFVKGCVSMSSVQISSSGTVGSHDIFLTGSNIASTVTQTWESLIGPEATLSNTEMIRIFCEEKDSDVKSGPLAYLLYPHTEGSVFVDGSFWDHESCGKEKLPCKSLTFAHSKLNTSNQKVVFLATCTLSGQINSLPLGSVLSTKPDQTVSTDQTTQFVVQAGPLSFEAIDIILLTTITKPLFVVRASVLSFASSVTINNSPSPSTHEAPLFSLSRGTLQLTETQLIFQPTFVSTRSLIEQTAGNLKLNGVTVQHVSKSAGDGSVLHSALSSTSNAIQISGASSFKDCHSTVGNGGALFISCPPSFPSSSLVVDATFADCSCGPAMKGEWVFVGGHTLKSLLAPDCWTNTIAGLTWDSANHLWGTDSNEAENSVYRSISLLVYFIPYRHQVIYVGTGWRNEDGCGSSTWKCQTLSQARDHLSGSAPFTLSIDTEATHSDGLAFSSETTIKGDPTTSKLMVTATGCLSATASTLSLSTLVLDGSSISRDSSLLTLSQTGSLDINRCTFTGFKSTADGAVFSSTLGTGTSITIANSAFSSCTSAGNGGALAITLNGGSLTLTDSNVTFSSCDGLNGKNVYLAGKHLVTTLAEGGLDGIKPSHPTNGIFQEDENDVNWYRQGIIENGGHNRFHQCILGS